MLRASAACECCVLKPHRVGSLKICISSLYIFAEENTAASSLCPQVHVCVHANKLYFCGRAVFVSFLRISAERQTFV